MPAENSIPKIVSVSLVLVTIVGLFLFVMNSRAGPGALTIKAGGSELVMNFADNKLNFSDLIKTLLSDDKYKNDTLAILSDNYGLYQEGSEKLVDQIRREPGNTHFAEMMRELLNDKKGPFEQKYHTFYDIQDVNTVDIIKALDYKSKVAVRLRELKDNSEGIFEQRGIHVRVAFYSDDSILDGNAAVCEGSRYRGRDLILLNPREPSKTISVFARNSFSCIRVDNGDEESDMLVQINHNDGKKLFGDILFSAKEEAVLFPIKKGDNAKPVLVGLNP